jgi:UDP-N-acetylglucosamine--N-acetylmuramyl-(pentapeptide) pyrophosphoryl-undecaprenol N-acetylglucosamine transferase
VPTGWQFAVIAGARDYEALHARLAGRADVAVLPYLDDPRPAFAAADLVLARAGASTLAELAATGTPALLVPYPHATADHQRLNAEAYAVSGAARVVADGELGAERLRRELAAMLADEPYARLHAAARALADTDPRTVIAARVKRFLSSNTAPP